MLRKSLMRSTSSLVLSLPTEDSTKVEDMEEGSATRREEEEEEEEEEGPPSVCKAAGTWLKVRSTGNGWMAPGGNDGDDDDDISEERRRRTKGILEGLALGVPAPVPADAI